MQREYRTGVVKWMRRGIAELFSDESGVTTTEYALVVVLLAVGAIMAYRNFGMLTGDIASNSTRALP